MTKGEVLKLIDAWLKVDLKRLNKEYNDTIIQYTKQKQQVDEIATSLKTNDWLLTKNDLAMVLTGLDFILAFTPFLNKAQTHKDNLPEITNALKQNYDFDEKELRQVEMFKKNLPKYLEMRAKEKELIDLVQYVFDKVKLLKEEYKDYDK